jgi:carbohydrate-selective porin OprB
MPLTHTSLPCSAHAITLLFAAGATAASASSPAAAGDYTGSRSAAQLKHGRHGIEYMQCLAAFSLRTGQVSGGIHCCIRYT